MTLPKHEYDRSYVPVPDAPLASMVDLPALPLDVRNALRLVREYEVETAVHPTLLANEVRAWFRHENRWTCSRCGHMVDTPQHELGCAGGRGT